MEAWTIDDRKTAEIGKIYSLVSAILPFPICSRLVDVCFHAKKTCDARLKRILKLEATCTLFRDGQNTLAVKVVKELDAADAKEISQLLVSQKASDQERYQFFKFCLDWNKVDWMLRIWQTLSAVTRRHMVELAHFHGDDILAFFKSCMQLDQYRDIDKKNWPDGRKEWDFIY